MYSDEYVIIRYIRLFGHRLTVPGPCLEWLNYNEGGVRYNDSVINDVTELGMLVVLTSWRLLSGACTVLKNIGFRWCRLSNHITASGTARTLTY